MHLLVDVPETPELSFITVEGSLIFEPDDDPAGEKTFDCNYIMVKGGYLEVGTEEYPYTSKLTITMHGTEEDPYLPLYGNKVIGVRYGVLEMHGVERKVTWTSLDRTANPGDSEITLLAQDGDFDWAAGEWIVIASTSLDGREAEKVKIVDARIEGGKPVFTIRPAL
jgi:hypothetical protein